MTAIDEAAHYWGRLRSEKSGTEVGRSPQENIPEESYTRPKVRAETGTLTGRPLAE